MTELGVEVGAAVHRAIRLPALLRIVDGRDEAIAAIVDAGLTSMRMLVVHSGAASGTGYGTAFTRDLRAAELDATEIVIGPPADGAVDLVNAAIGDRRSDLVIGIGGGLLTDIAKLASFRAGIPFLSVPTQASSDGLCSPVAVIPDRNGRPHSIGARIPAALIVDMNILGLAPRRTWLAGLGDLVSNLSAVRDWRWAHREFGEPVDDFACLTAEAAALSVIEVGVDLDDRDYRQKLIRGLVLSGVAMEMAGSSRPASGSEHLISHALDGAAQVRCPHGLQVAMTTLASYWLRGDDSSDLRRFYRSVGLPEWPASLGLRPADVVAAARLGPATRPDRRTILDRFDTASERGLLRFLEQGDTSAHLA